MQPLRGAGLVTNSNEQRKLGTGHCHRRLDPPEEIRFDVKTAIRGLPAILETRYPRGYVALARQE